MTSKSALDRPHHSQFLCRLKRNRSSGLLPAHLRQPPGRRHLLQCLAPAAPHPQPLLTTGDWLVHARVSQAHGLPVFDVKCLIGYAPGRASVQSGGQGCRAGRSWGGRSGRDVAGSGFCGGVARYRGRGCAVHQHHAQRHQAQGHEQTWRDGFLQPQRAKQQGEQRREEDKY